MTRDQQNLRADGWRVLDMQGLVVGDVTRATRRDAHPAAAVLPEAKRFVPIEAALGSVCVLASRGIRSQQVVYPLPGRNMAIHSLLQPGFGCDRTDSAISDEEP